MYKVIGWEVFGQFTATNIYRKLEGDWRGIIGELVSIC